MFVPTTPVAFGAGETALVPYFVRYAPPPNTAMFQLLNAWRGVRAQFVFVPWPAPPQITDASHHRCRCPVITTFDVPSGIEFTSDCGPLGLNTMRLPA